MLSSLVTYGFDKRGLTIEVNTTTLSQHSPSSQAVILRSLLERKVFAVFTLASGFCDMSVSLCVGREWWMTSVARWQ